MNTCRTTVLRNLTSTSALRVALGAVALGATFGLASEASAQSFPFPSTNVNNGTTTSVLTSHELGNLYDYWRESFVERCNQGDARIRYPESQNDTRSEGVGYGMVIAAYMGDQETFDGLWNYYKRASPTGNASSLMHWRRDGCGVGGGGADTGSASDADIDAAFGLIVADRQFPGAGYAGEASQLVATIRQQLFQNGCQGILTAGSQFSDCGCINPSYIPPGYYTSFGQVDQAAFWDSARDASYTYFNNVSNNATGLVPAWSSSNGSLNLGGGCNPQVAGGGQPDEFQADAARTPWRVAADFLWTGDTRAQQFLSSIADFAQSQRIVQIVDRYSLAGTPLNGNGQGQDLDATGFRSTYTMGGFATAMAASSQNNLDEFTGAWQSLYLPGDSLGPNGPSPRAFNTSLALLYGLTVTGFAWDPAGAAPVPVAEPALTAQGQSLIVNGDFDEGVTGWQMGVFGGGASEAFAMHRDGEMNFRIQEVETAAPFNLQFFQPVSLVAGQRYLMSVTARADSPRPLVMLVGEDGGEFTTYGQLINRSSATETGITLTPQMTTYETVFEAPASDPAARFAFQLGQSVAGLTVDNVSLVPTDLPVSEAGDLEGVEPAPENATDATDPGSPGSTNTPSGDGAGSTNNGNLNQDVGAVAGEDVSTASQPPQQGQVQPPNGGEPVGAASTGPVAPAGAPVLPAEGVACRPASSGQTEANGRPITLPGDDCYPFNCSEGLGLCFDATTGLVYNRAAGPGEQPWQLPPPAGCEPYLFLPGTERCYDPDTGYIYNPQLLIWEYWGDNFTRGPDPVSADGCSVSAPAGQTGSSWLALGLLGLATAWRSSRRRRS